MLVSGKAVNNCAFGGIDGKTLLITIDGGAYSLQTKVKGRPTTGVLPTKNHRKNPAKAIRGSLKLHWDPAGTLRYSLYNDARPYSLAVYTLNGTELCAVNNQSSTGTIKLAGIASQAAAMHIAGYSAENLQTVPLVR